MKISFGFRKIGKSKIESARTTVIFLENSEISRNSTFLCYRSQISVQIFDHSLLCYTHKTCICCTKFVRSILCVPYQLLQSCFSSGTSDTKLLEDVAYVAHFQKFNFSLLQISDFCTDFRPFSTVLHSQNLHLLRKICAFYIVCALPITTVVAVYGIPGLRDTIIRLPELGTGNPRTS